MNNNVSVIIATYNGADKIRFLLEALELQTIRDFEIIVMIDGSSDNTLSVVESYVKRFAAIRIISQENSGRSKVRNRGTKEAAGELLIFYDDDMVPFPDSVEKHIAIHSAYKDILLAGNPQEYVELQKTDVQNYKATIASQWTSKYMERLTILDKKNLFFTASNCSVSKKIFYQLSGFDERLTDAEDYNLGWRALNSGIKVLFDKENKAIHREFITANSYVLRLRQYGKAHRKLAELYPETAFAQDNSTSTLKHLFYRVFALRLWITWIDNGVFTFLPVTLRYRIYSIVFHALAVEYPHTKI